MDVNLRMRLNYIHILKGRDKIVNENRSCTHYTLFSCNVPRLFPNLLGTYIMQPKKLGWSLRTMLYCNALSMRLLTCLWAFYLVSGIYLHMYYVISSVPINHWILRHISKQHCSCSSSFCLICSRMKMPLYHHRMSQYINSVSLGFESE